MNQHMPFITIIGVIKVGHLWAKCNTGLAGFFILLLPWCLCILVSRLCVTLILVTPLSLSLSLPRPKQYSVFPTALCSGCQHRARPPLLTSDLHLFPFASFYLLGHFTFGKYLLGNHKPFAIPWHSNEFHSHKEALAQLS